MQNGWSLIELMIVLAIIGVLAGLALPAYQDYSSRAQLARAVHEVSELKHSVEVLVNDGVVPSTSSSLGFTGSSLFEEVGSNGVSIIVDGDVVSLVATMGAGSNYAIRGVKVFLTRDSNGTWLCIFDTTASHNWKSEYLPSSCSLM
ncbi:pilin [Pokkaliibacter sp. MBI-7]|uniref:pilin n=1 Tax=Pokkaliibacter sp. MBI-7 TaxID=3040600 RepID=UPI00244D2F18|nr:pilin [Pokkaliibacter sp. MBI-7]MDH2436394.1 pilin [Pokkaliibacter sp. MBI-7]